MKAPENTFKAITIRAWEIRKAAAAKFNCPVMSIVWGMCFDMAKAEMNNKETSKRNHVCIRTCQQLTDSLQFADEPTTLRKVIGLYRDRYELESSGEEFFIIDWDKTTIGISDSENIDKEFRYNRPATNWHDVGRGLA